MTIAQSFREEGRQEGRQEGAATLLSNLLKNRFHRSFTKKYLQMIEKADSKTIFSWAEKVLHAEQIEDVFSGRKKLRG